ncbi:flagellar biosynthesis protein FlgA [Mycobacterium sp. CBMA293]|uniref:SAF domain-containing protein n=1 Tax=unclassified Mycolicibacterium TaxID=2636767 RepID=UPI0012DF22B0|nr:MULTISPECIES: SAF domain-containing protein [unclassified Mycolicibacterium]MUL49996.1 flagellar biosynthesis protein FlgA [Mycolicibacterium sp. CBMA 360]MUL61602.1 flagellar biosynthesis protein FlgA [Mycolicibacterium sp. CBMA 335]MUL74337.1 flagellar biosynthesis protein FlgA [Mycolicibacterium sp. CBMA 311]MUL96614.1 flagellar biosynthesis protein FlgA [Mycolicibacterium sp. CBMA 230]MUM04227.1 flagellar biosynthesis protein FlgA [Mycolicibacterium sp. CBMA 213]
MGDSLDAPLIGRLTQRLRPDWARTTAARRVAAGLLVIFAAVVEFRPAPEDGMVDVVVAKRDLSPGSALSVDDIVVESRSAPSLPDGALHDASGAIGSTLAAPARRGEVITDVRLLGPRLTAAIAGPDARIVPLHLADAALPDLLHSGDVVDVLAGPESTGVATDQTPTEVIATDARVVLVSERGKSATRGDDRVVLVALPRQSANTVAGAALHRSITVTLH